MPGRMEEVEHLHGSMEVIKLTLEEPGNTDLGLDGGNLKCIVSTVC